MTIERTLILCKPDAVSRGLVGEIISRIERRGYIIVAMKLMQLDGERAREHYGEHKGKPFFGELVDSSPAARWSRWPSKAKARSTVAASSSARRIRSTAAPGSIRGDFAQTIGRNLVHGSDGKASAERELKIFFDANEFVSRRHDLERWIKE